MTARPNRGVFSTMVVSDLWTSGDLLRVSRAFASLVFCGVLAGITVAAAVFPALLLVGLTAKSAADSFESLPTRFDVLPTPQITSVYFADGRTLMANLYDENRRDVPLASVAPVMRQAIVAAEDKSFYRHHGVDLKGVARAFVKNQESVDKQGASTLTMQYVRQVIQYSARTPEQVVAATEQTATRKIREIRYASALEKQLSKEQILERYLNIVAFGQGAYGIWAASQVYFDKSPAELTLAEAALLAGLVKAPSTYDPTTSTGKPQALARSRTYVLGNMLALGYITQAQRDAAALADPQIAGQHPPQGCTEVQGAEIGAGFFCDYLVRWWGHQQAFGDSQYERENRLMSGGYRIRTSLDVRTQRIAHGYARSQTGVSNSRAVLLAAVEPGTGRVRALATNRIFSNDQSSNGVSTNRARRAAGEPGSYPSTTLPLITGGAGVPGFQAGSAFKVFTMIAALERGYPLAYEIDAEDVARTSYIVDPGSPAACPGTHFYCPRNAGEEAGTYTMWGAFGRSVNTYFVPLQERVGAGKVVEVAQRLGLTFRSESDARLAARANANQWGAFTLGVSASTPLDMATAWAALAADGRYCAPTPVVAILDLDGNPVDAGNPRCQDGTVARDVARAAIDAARCPVGDRSPTSQCVGATAGDLRGIVGKPLAGKTGTTDGDSTATMTMTTRQLAISGYLVDPDWPAHPGVGDHGIINDAVAYTLRDAMSGHPAIDFTSPSRAIVSGTW